MDASLRVPALIAVFDDFPPLRIDRTKKHRPSDIVTIALGAGLGGADSIVEHKGDDVLALKANQPALHEAGILLFAEERETT